MVRTVAFKATSLGSKPYTYVRSRDEVFDFQFKTLYLSQWPIPMKKWMASWMHGPKIEEKGSFSLCNAKMDGFLNETKASIARKA